MSISRRARGTVGTIPSSSVRQTKWVVLAFWLINQDGLEKYVTSFGLAICGMLLQAH